MKTIFGLHISRINWRDEWAELYGKFVAAESALGAKSKSCGECFFMGASLRKQLSESETDRLKWMREAEVANLHLAGERRSNAALKGQITKLKGARRG